MSRGDRKRLESECFQIVESAPAQCLFLAAWPVEAPFPDVAEDVVQPELVGGSAPDRFRCSARGLLAGDRLLKCGISQEFLPLRLCRQGINEAGRDGASSLLGLSELLAKLPCLFPCDGIDRKPWIALVLARIFLRQFD